MASPVKLKKPSKGDPIRPLEIRVGQGFDVHPLVSGRSLFLGGIKVPFRKGLKGHSDGDVLLHAVIDALLGASGKGDIGVLFPNTEARWRGADSRELLKSVYAEVVSDGWRVVNLDCTVLAESPKLKPYIPAIKECISKITQIAPTACGIKATTCEGLGFVGRREGIAAMAVALLQR